MQGQWVNKLRAWRQKGDVFLGPIAKVLTSAGIETVEDLQGVDVAKLPAIPQGDMAETQRAYLATYIADMQKPAPVVGGVPSSSALQSGQPLTAQGLASVLAPQQEHAGPEYA